MVSLKETKVTEFLTNELGRVPTSSEISQGMKAPWSLANIHNDLNVGQSVLSISPTDDLQDAIDMVDSNGGGVVYLKGGTYDLVNNIVIPSNVHIVGVGSGGSILDFGGTAHQVQAIGTAMDQVVSVKLQGITIQNSSTALLKLDYCLNFSGNDITVMDGLKGIEATNMEIFNFDTFSSDTCDTGIDLSTCDSMTLNNMAVTGATVGGFIFDTVNNATYINSSVDTSTGVGISMTDCGDFTLDSYSLVDITGIGMLCDNTTVMSAASGTIANCSSDGVRLQNGTSNCQFVTSNFNDNGGYGVNITTAGCASNLFAINDFSGNSSGAMSDSGTGTLVRSNIGLADN